MGRLCRCCRRGRSKGRSKGHPKNPPKGQRHPKTPAQAQRRLQTQAQPPRPPMTSPMTSAVPAYVIWPPPAIVTLGGPRVALLGEGKPQTRCF